MAIDTEKKNYDEIVIVLKIIIYILLTSMAINLFILKNMTKRMGQLPYFYTLMTRNLKFDSRVKKKL